MGLGVLLFLLPRPEATALAGLAFAAALIAIPAGQRPNWIAFAVSTLLIGVMLYGLTIPAEPALHLGRFQVSRAGAITGAVAMSRLVGFFSLGMVAAHWIPARELMPLVGRRALPFYVAASLVRLVPTIRDDLERIRLSQEARGHEWRRKWYRSTQYLPLIVPLFVSTVRRAREQAVAIELAGLAPARRPR